MKSRKIIDIALSIVIAVLLWAYVVNVVNPPSTTVVRSVPVQLLNEEVLASSSLAISGTKNYTVDVTVAGNRTDISDVTANQLVATADLFGLSAGQNYLTVNVTCPSTMTVEEVRSQRIQVFIEELVSVNKPVNLVIGDVDEGYEVTMESTGSQFITVSGAKTLVNKVMDIYAELDPDEFPLDETTPILLDAIPRDKDGNEVEGVKLSSSYVEVRGTVYATKTVALSVNLDGDPAFDAEVDYSNLPSRILIKGPQEALSSVRSITTKPIDINGMIEDKSVKLVPNLPEDIMLSDDAGSLKVTITLIDAGKIVYKIPAEDVEIVGYDDEVFEARLSPLVMGDSITVTVTGGLQDLAAAEQEMFVPYVNVSDIGEAGTFAMELIDPYEGNEYTVTYESDIILVEMKSLLPEEDPEDPEESEQADGGF